MALRHQLFFVLSTLWHVVGLAFKQKIIKAISVKLNFTIICVNKYLILIDLKIKIINSHMKPVLIFAALVATFSVQAQCPNAPGVTLSSQSAVNSFSVTYPGCDTLPVGSDLIITGNDIVNLAGLNEIKVINSAVEIRSNPNLLNLSGFSPTYASSDFIIRDNAKLQNINALSSLDTVLGEFTIRTNPLLTDISGLSSLKYVGLAVIVRDNASLTNLNGLNNLRFVGEVLELVENPALTDVSALSNIDSIMGGPEGALVIDANDVLAGLQGLGNSNTKILGDLIITGNPQLSLCAVISVCNYLLNPPAGAATTISLNKLGCNTIPEVQSQCATVSLHEKEGQLNILTYPNPASDFIHVENKTGYVQQLSIVNQFGQIVLTDLVKNNDAHVINISNINSGLYYIIVKSGEEQYRSKLIIN